MKAIIKSSIPDSLKNYVEKNPKDDWEKDFKNSAQDGYREVVQKIKFDQGGICCYCEIKFNEGLSERDDFRVEHFHPKSDNSIPTKNWHLDWTNLLGCCHGGTDKSVQGGQRFIENKLHRHSDVLKAENTWDKLILDPLVIPADRPIFSVNRKDGSLEVIESNCSPENIIKAKNCLDESFLNLNTKKLNGFRKLLLDRLNDELRKDLEITQDLTESLNKLVKIRLSKDKDGNYLGFFSTIRSFYGKIAEEYLNSIDYKI